jgi:hypothetical protein
MPQHEKHARGPGSKPWLVALERRQRVNFWKLGQPAWNGECAPKCARSAVTPLAPATTGDHHADTEQIERLAQY